MSIARDFTEGLQKAMRMVNTSYKGFEPMIAYTDESRDIELTKPTPNRMFALADAFYNAGYSVDHVHELTKIDRWFLSKLEYMAVLSNDMSQHTLESLPKSMLVHAKKAGFSDEQIASRVKSTEAEVRKMRKEAGILPIFKQIDTLAAEFPAQTNYMYATYNGKENDIEVSEAERGTVIVGCGTYRIGSSVEFDHGSVIALRTIREKGGKTIMINNNPETVSTDYDESDRLYFEELSLERVLDIYEFENALGCIVSYGGQIPNNLAMPLKKNGVKIMGTDPDMIDNAEDRNAHSAMLDKLGIDQPAWSALTNLEAATAFCAKVGYPVLVRPSYVLSGAAMNVVRSEAELKRFLDMATEVSADKPVVISKFIEGSEEIDIDGVAHNGKLLAYAISEHVEQGGVHSGDASLILPAREMKKEVFLQCKDIVTKIAKQLNITGPLNMQILYDGKTLKVIETNVRASRSLPFSSKVLDVDFTKIATLAMMGYPVEDAIAQCDKQQELPYVCVKVPQFSFKRLPGADPTLGVEMSSTGEVACFHQDKHGAYLRALQSSLMTLPRVGQKVWFSLPPAEKKAASDKACKAAKIFQGAGYPISAGEEDAKRLQSSGCDKVEVVLHVERRTDSQMVKQCSSKEIALVLELTGSPKELWYHARRGAIDMAVPLITNVEQALLTAEALEKYGTTESILPSGNFKEGDPCDVETYEELMDLKN